MRRYRWLWVRWGQKFESDTFNIPPDKQLPGKNIPTSYVLIGDEAFPLKHYMMKPFPYRISRQDPHKENYNGPDAWLKMLPECWLRSGV